VQARGIIGVVAPQSTELLPLRVRLRGLGTIDEETDGRDHQQRRQIHLSQQEICPKNRSHPYVRPERPPISISKEEAIAEIIMHSEAAWSEHRAVNSTKMGLHYELPSWLGAAAENFYAKLDSPYVLPLEFFTLADSNPETLELFRSYYAETQAARSWRTYAIRGALCEASGIGEYKCHSLTHNHFTTIFQQLPDLPVQCRRTSSSRQTLQAIPEIAG
jgi:hypothetical protein